MLVRIARDEDIDEVVDLDRQCIPGCAWSRDEATTLFVIKDIDDHVCAYASLRTLEGIDEGSAYFDRAGVAPWARGRGLQRQLIRARERWCRRHGMRIGLTYTLATNPRSSNNLMRCGWRLYSPAYAWEGRGVLYWYREFSLRA